jgi:hypothetical protein
MTIIQKYTSWNSNQFEDKYVLIYDSINDNLITETYYVFNLDSNVWNVENKAEYIYNSNGFITQYILYWWNNDLKELLLRSKQVMDYDNNGNQILYEYYTWDSESNQWIGYGNKFIDIYNSDNKIIYRENYIWEQNKNNWKYSSRLHYYYTNYNMTYSPNNKYLHNLNRSNKNNFYIYPNPTDGRILIKSNNNEIATISFYNLKGEKIKSIHSNVANNELNLFFLSDGYYIIKIELKSDTFTERILIKR